MLKMRLQRIGRKNDPAYRVIVTDSRQGPKSGKYIDLLGTYNPKMGQISIDGDKVKEWISKGVQVSDTVHNMLIDKKIIEGKKINALSKKTPIVKEAEEAPKEDAPAGEPLEEKAEESVEEPKAEETPTEEKAEPTPQSDGSDSEEGKEEAKEPKEEKPAEEPSEEVKEDEGKKEEAGIKN